MPFMKNGKRDYQAEKEWDHSHKNGKRLKDRAARNRARRKLGLKVGDPRHVDHIKELVRGGTNSLANLHAMNAKSNLKKEANRKKKAARSSSAANAKK